MSNASHELRPLPRRLSSRAKRWRRVELVSLWIRRCGITLALSTVLYNVLCAYRGIPVW